ncbi:hypothetical protein CVU37_06820 [candidate division BRC1 bacterium HGW-BRC1-1]|jgi:PAS domain S-box-containing protein|nr:MAG: hypothetical protein CVU37_06820 [candidate division BRC1 bacterium HGW-BRC1-1]
MKIIGGIPHNPGPCARDLADRRVRCVVSTEKIEVTSEPGALPVVAVYSVHRDGMHPLFLGLAVVPSRKPDSAMVYASLLPTDPAAAVAPHTPVTVLPDLFARQPSQPWRAVVDGAGKCLGVIDLHTVALALKDELVKTRMEDLDQLHMQYQAILRATPNGLLFLGRDWRILFANHAARMILHPQASSDEVIVGMPFGEFFPTVEEFRTYRAGLVLSGASEESRSSEISMKRFSNESFWAVLSVIRMDQTQTASGYVATLADITLRRRALLEGHRAESRFHTLVHESIAGFFVLYQGRVAYINRRCCEIAGFGHRDEMLRRPLPRRIVAHQDAAFARRMKEDLTRGSRFITRGELRIVNHRSGRQGVVFLQMRRVMEDDRGTVVGMVLDVTSQREAEKQREGLAKLGFQLAGASKMEDVANAVRDATASFFRWDSFSFHVRLKETEDQFVCVSASRVDIRGEMHHFPASLTGMSSAPELLSRKSETVIVELTKDNVSILQTLHHQFPDTEVLAVSPIKAREETTGFICVGSNNPASYTAEDCHYLDLISQSLAQTLERFRAELQMERLANAMEQSSEGVVIAFSDWSIVYVNAAFERLIGQLRAEVVGLDARRVPEIIDNAASLRRAMEAVVSRGDVWTGRVKSRGAGGRVFEEDVRITPMRNEAGDIMHYVFVRRDITHEMALENRLRQATKMEALGMLAGGVAHDFNNLLGLAQQHTHALLKRLPHNDPSRHDVEGIEKMTGRGIELTSQLLSLARRRQMKPVLTDINEVVNSVVGMIETFRHQGIDVEMQLERDLPKVYVDPMQLEQVLLNLARNAQDAMPEGGNLTFITQHLQSQDLSARGVVGLKEGGHVCVLVLDNGVGMSAETLERIYEPFFTTKEAGKGTGLGLASAYGTITQSGGQVHAESKPGKGSSFTVCLPVSPEAEQRFQVDIVREDSDGTAARHVLDLGGDPAATGRRMGRGKETILLVENEPDLRRLWASALIEDGYEVIQSRNSMDAGMLFTNVEIPIHLLVTDLVLQDKSGSELAASVRQYHPEVAVLYVCNSGDLPKAIPEALMPYTAHARKPLTPGMLCMAVRELLDFVSGDSLRLSQKYQKGK